MAQRNARAIFCRVSDLTVVVVVVVAVGEEEEEEEGEEVVKSVFPIAKKKRLADSLERNCDAMYRTIAATKRGAGLG